MQFAIVAAVYPIIFLGELPDKTMFASLVMSTRGRPLAVWLGAAECHLDLWAEADSHANRALALEVLTE